MGNLGGEIHRGFFIVREKPIWLMKSCRMEIAVKGFVIDSISLSNYRKFEDITFHLNLKMNVFIGKNASGKTSVIEAVSVMLGAYLAAFKEYVLSRFDKNISDADVRRKNNKFIFRKKQENEKGTTIAAVPFFVGWRWCSRSMSCANQAISRGKHGKP